MTERLLIPVFHEQELRAAMPDPNGYENSATFPRAGASELDDAFTPTVLAGAIEELSRGYSPLMEQTHALLTAWAKSEADKGDAGRITQVVTSWVRHPNTLFANIMFTGPAAAYTRYTSMDLAVAELRRPAVNVMIPWQGAPVPGRLGLHLLSQGRLTPGFVSDIPPLSQRRETGRLYIECLRVAMHAGHVAMHDNHSQYA